MKVCTITIHFGVNYGSALQAFALFEYLRQVGHDVSVIDYVPERYSAWNVVKSKKHPLLVKLAYYLITFPSRNRQRRMFERFLCENLILTKRYNRNELMKNPPTADAYIAGSDQIWNVDYNGDDEYSYFLNFAATVTKRISYAASFGRDSIGIREQGAITKYLQKFDYISVRERSGLNILEQCGVKSREQVLDPTLLLDKARWKMLASNIVIDSNYVLIYVMDNQHEKLVEYGSQIALRLNLKLYVICFKKIKDSRIDLCFTNITPQEFLALFDQASYVVSNSYHGILFAINFSKQFIAVAKDRYNTRISSILELVEIPDRFIYNRFVLEEVLEQINYEQVNLKIYDARHKSAQFLEKALQV